MELEPPRNGHTEALMNRLQAFLEVLLLSGLGIGLFASTIANTQQEAMLTIFMTMLPSIFLSGFFFPLEAMPAFLRFFSYFVPLRYFLVIIRTLCSKVWAWK
jgi:ABC-2 type transport system permease protein